MSAASREIVVIKPTEADQKTKAKALEAWDRARLELIQWRPFLGTLAMQLQIIPVVDDRCRTACTDGKRVFCNAEYMLSRSESDSLFILAHEVLHCALQHFNRQDGKMENHEMWNFAIDHEVNTILKKDGFEVPNGAVLYPQHIDKSAEQVYIELLEDRLQMRGTLVDEHDLGENSLPSEECDWDGPLEMKIDPDYTPMRSDSVWRQWASKVMIASRQAQRHGETSIALQRVLDKLDPSKIDWKTLLKRWSTSFMGGSRTWLPPNRRYVHQGLYLPSRRGHRIDMVAVIDTSGSVWEHGVLDFLSELQGIIRSFGEYEITVLQVDTEVRDVQVFDFTNPFEADRFQIEGGGCNRFTPAFDWVKKNKANSIKGMVYMTDGYLFTGEPDPPPVNPPPYPVLWVLTEDGSKPVRWGEVLKLEHNA